MFREPGSVRGLSSPVVEGDVAIALGTSGVYGIALATGEQRFFVPREGGPLAAPALADAEEGRLLLFTEAAGEAGTRLVAVDLESREEVWDLMLGAVSRSGVTVDGARAIVGDDDGIVYAADVETGKELWRVATAGRVDAPLAAAHGNVYVASPDARGRGVAVRALDGETGEESWSFAPAASGASAIAVAGDVALTGFFDRTARAIDAADGVQRWASTLNSLVSPLSAPVAVDGQVFVVDVSGGLYRLDLATGERVWGFQFNQVIVRSSPIVIGQVVLVGLNDGRLVAVDRASGRMVWGSAARPGAIGALASSGDRIVAAKGGRDGGLVAFEHDPEGTLVDVASPTVLMPGYLLLNFALAFVAVFGGLMVVYRVLPRLRRRGVALTSREES